MSNDGGGTSPNGRVIGGRYRLVERIGSGGMGTVWRAIDELVEREVAVKQPRLPGDPEDEAHQRAAHRLYREARAAARVDHPAAVSIHDVVAEDGLPWIVMELVRGESLHEVLRRGPVEATEAARIGLAVLGALRAAHAVGIVHRDVKPANVLLGPHRRVVLTDFGIAHIQGEESLTVSGEFVGSLEFIAPERMSGSGAGPASDLWSLGVLLYAAVEGWSPFRRTTLESTLAAILGAHPPEPKQAGPLGPLIVRLLAKEPRERPGPEETGAVLEAVAQGRPVPDPVAQGRQVPEPVAQGRQVPESVAQGRQVPDPVSGVGGAGAPEATEPRESAEDPGTVRLRGAAAPEGQGEPEPEPEVTSASARGATSDPTSSIRERGGRRLLRPVPVAALGILLAGATWFTASFLPFDEGDAPKQTVGARGSSPTAPERTATPAPGTWIAHRHKDMAAVLSLPAEYKEAAREGGASGRPRLVVYDIGLVQVRLTQWDKSPRPLLDQARYAHETWNKYNHDAGTQATRTVFKGYDAVLSDTTYDKEESPTRVMQLFVVTGDDRMYELRVDMPKGTPSEKKGTAVFKGARDRLEIE